MRAIVIILMLQALLPGSVAAAQKSCGVIPPEKLTFKFEDSRASRTRLYIGVPLKYENAKFDRVEAIYRDAAQQVLKFPIALLSKDPDDWFGSIWLPSKYRSLDVTAIFRRGDCVMQLSAAFVDRQRVK